MNLNPDVQTAKDAEYREEEGDLHERTLTCRLSRVCFPTHFVSAYFAYSVVPTALSGMKCALWTVTLLLGLALAGCKSSEAGSRNRSAPPADWLAWQAKRRESLAGPNGWTTLAGLHWLEEGRNSAGSSPTNHVVLPRRRAAASIGNFVRAGRVARFEAAPGVVATVAGKPVQAVELQSDAALDPTVLQIGPLSIIVLERGERIGLRVRDPEAATRTRFRGVRYFAYDPAWRIAGRLEPAPAVEKLRVPDMIGGTQEFVVPGTIVFTHAGAEHRLVAVEEPGEEDYFVMFRDHTAGASTYPTGRYLYVAKPDATGRVTIDFNRAYTPPCGFTPFATCPLPPRQNWLPFEVRAGEQKPPDHH
jgi:uncharacterized protein (DUF1684 family)